MTDPVPFTTTWPVRPGGATLGFTMEPLVVPETSLKSPRICRPDPDIVAAAGPTDSVAVAEADPRDAVMLAG